MNIYQYCFAELYNWGKMGITIEEAYTILGVTKNANANEIKAAYRRLALATHPDKVYPISIIFFFF